MNEDDWEDSAKDPSSTLPSSSSSAAAASASVRPPTDSIYPVQAPYGDLQVQGLTPPPDEFGFDAILRDCQFPTQFNLPEPPTPPRTEAVSSPSRSSHSGGSSPSDEPASPDSDAVMGDDLGPIVCDTNACRFRPPSLHPPRIVSVADARSRE